MRDPAHIIRTSCRDPFHDAALFNEQHHCLFDSQGAVLKDFHYSKQSARTCWRHASGGFWKKAVP
eukprot:7149652-Lingulodinium_polyedra.AAC.1